MITITKRQFRFLLVAQVVFFILLYALPFVMGQFMSEAERTVYEYLPEDLSLSMLQLVVGLIFVPIGIWAIQNLYALFTFKSYAPKHLLIVTSIGFAVGLLIDPLGIYVYTGFESMVITLYGMSQGAVLALVFTSNLADEFCGCAPKEIESALPATQS